MEELIEELRSEATQQLEQGGGADRLAKQHEAGQADRARAHRRPGRSGQLRGDRPVRPAPRRPTSAWPARSCPPTAWSPARRRSTAAWSTSPARTSPSLGGSAGEVHSHKVAEMMELSLKTGSPFVFINDSGGARVQEGIDSLSRLRPGVLHQRDALRRRAADLADLRPLRRRRGVLARRSPTSSSRRARRRCSSPARRSSSR